METIGLYQQTGQIADRFSLDGSFPSILFFSHHLGRQVTKMEVYRAAPL